MKVPIVSIVVMAASACGSSQSTSATDQAIVTADAPLSDALTLTPVAPLSEIPPAVTPNDTNFAGLINGLRRGDGLPDLTFDARLNEAAQQHAQDMVDNDFFNHTSLDGRTPQDRIIAEGYIPSISGENIALGPQSEADVFVAWQGSEDHDAILRLEGVEDFAIGVAGEGQDMRWVLLVAAER